MNRREALNRARQALFTKLTEDASLEGEILLRHVLKIDRTALFSYPEEDITQAQLNELDKLIARRLEGEPSAYITGHKEFYGLDFKVNWNVLIPRPETELLVEKAIGIAHKNPISKVADIGTGCGAIAICLAVHLPDINVYATDVSSSALKVAKENCRSHSVTDRIVLLQGDMLEPLPKPVDMIIANLPYVRKTEIPEKGPLSYEPELALNGGEDGLDKIEQLCLKAGKKINKGGYLFLEVGQGQTQGVTDILHKIYPFGLIEVERDLVGIERVVSLCLT